jgi:hypothetical protein
MSDTECEKTHLQKRHLAKKEDPDAMMVKPGLVFAAGALNSAHWTSPPIKKLEERSVKHLVKQCTHEIDEVQAQIDNEMHQLHFEVLLRHQKRLISVYKSIADDHNFTTLVRIDRRPSKTQEAIRQGADLASHILKTCVQASPNPNDDAAMASSTAEPTAREEAAREE